MKTFITILFALISFSSFASTGTCEIRYSSTEDYKIRWMEGDREVLEDATFEECISRAESNLGTKKKWKSVLRNDVRKITMATYKFHGESVISSGKLSLPGYEH